MLAIFSHEPADATTRYAANLVKLHTPLLKGTLVKRYRRFLADVRLDDGRVVTTHCPNSGTMVGCSEPGRPVIVSDSGDDSRRHPLTWEMIEMNGTWVGINTNIAKKLVADAIERKLVPKLTEYTELQRDATYGIRTKIDIMLHGMDENCFINVHGVTWAENGVALFPEVVNERARKSLNELTSVARKEHRAVAFYLVQRGDCTIFKPSERVDREYLKAFLAANSAGVEIMVYRAEVTPESIELGTPIPFSID